MSAPRRSSSARRNYGRCSRRATRAIKRRASPACCSTRMASSCRSWKARPQPQGSAASWHHGSPQGSGAGTPVSPVVNGVQGFEPAGSPGRARLQRIFEHALDRERIYRRPVPLRKTPARLQKNNPLNCPCRRSGLSRETALPRRGNPSELKGERGCDPLFHLTSHADDENNFLLIYICHLPSLAQPFWLWESL